MKKLWYISGLIPIIFYLIWILSRFIDSPIFIFFIFLLPVLFLFSIVWTIILLLKVKFIRYRIIPLIVLSLIPVIDSIFNLRFKIEDSVRPEKIFIAMDEGPIGGRILNARINNKFEYEVSSWTGTEIYSGEYKIQNDTFLLSFPNQEPKIYGERPLYWIINKNENILEITTDRKNKFVMKILKNDFK